MSKTLFNILTAAVIGLIAAALSALAGEPVADSAAYGLLGAVFAYVLFMPAVSTRLKHICCELDWAEETGRAYQNIPAVYRRSFWYLFALINLAFLFHTVNFMWGGTDWAAVRTTVDTNESLADGRFSAFWLQQLLFNGKILPVANNLWAFLGLSLAGVFLAVYWNLPQKTAPIVITGLLFTVTPYTLSWLYSAKNTLGSLWLPALSLGALILADVKTRSQNRNFANNITSVMITLIVLGSYLPAVNFIAVAVLGKVFLKTAYADISLKDAFLRVRQSLVNLTAAVMVYLLIMSLLKDSGVLASPFSLTDPFAACWFNLPLLFKSAVSQFAVVLPFVDISYQILFLILTVSAIFTVIFNTPSGKTAARSLALIPLIILASKLSVLFCTNPEDVTVYNAQINFYGLPLIYALMFVTLIRLGTGLTRRLAYILAVLLILMGYVRVAYGQKVWKFGWDAETKLAERIITRLEKMPEFDINRQYKLLQIGEFSLRSKYYLPKAGEVANGNLLQKPYYPAGKSKDAYNFYYQTDFLSADATADEVRENPAVRDYILNRARPYPAKESLWIHGDYIIFVLNPAALAKFRSALN